MHGADGAKAAAPEKITLREFKMWLEGLLAGNEDRRSLPSLDQWRSVLAMIERIEDGKKEPPSTVYVPISAATLMPTPASPSYFVSTCGTGTTSNNSWGNM